jgi:hypothetical protein
MKETTEKAKIQNIIEMAFTFSAMTRVFEKGSNKKITAKLAEVIREIFSLNSKEEYDEKHKVFCEWFVKNIKTAERRKKDGRIIKESQYASWGQGAKVVDVVLKVCIYYCNLPSNEVSRKIIPWLNGAVDTKMIKELKRRYPHPVLSQTCTIEDVDNTKYKKLQRLLRVDIRESFSDEIFPVQWDDIMWRALNR